MITPVFKKTDTAPVCGRQTYGIRWIKKDNASKILERAKQKQHHSRNQKNRKYFPDKFERFSFHKLGW